MKSDINRTLLKLASKFTTLVKKHFGDNLLSIVLFGSVARKEANEHSDIDLIIVMEGLPAGRLSRNQLIEPIEDALEKDIDVLREKGIFTAFNYLLKTREESKEIRPIYLDLTEECVYLYDRNNFFKRIITDLKKKLERLGSKRHKVGSVRYWELKPDLKPGEVFEI